VVIEASADAYITGGSAAEVVACRRRLDGAAPAGLRPMLLWRGAVGPGDQGIARVASMLESGADGLVAVLDQDAALGGRLHRAEVAQALDAVGSHAARLGL
jgi:hypothetical protein